MIDESNLKTVSEIIGMISTHPIWQIKKGYGSFVTMDMGAKIKKTKNDGSEYLSGEYHLWLYTCKWSLFQKGKVILDSDKIDSNNSAKLGALKGECVQSIDFKNKESEVLLSFSNDLEFRLSSEEGSDSEDDFFIFYDGDRLTISYCLEDGLVVEKSSPV